MVEMETSTGQDEVGEKKRTTMSKRLSSVFSYFYGSRTRTRTSSDLGSDTASIDSEVLPHSQVFVPRIVSSERGGMPYGELLTQSHVDALAPHFSIPLQMQKIECIYMLEQDGCDLTSFYNKAKKIQNTIIVVRSVKGAIFGGFNSVDWQSQETYYGNGESFLYSFKQFQKEDSSNSNSSVSTVMATVCKWTGANTLFVHSDDEQIAMGRSRFKSKSKI